MSRDRKELNACPECGCPVRSDHLREHLKSAHRLAFCSECGCTVKPSRLPEHLKKVHGTSEADIPRDKTGSKASKEETGEGSKLRRKRKKINFIFIGVLILIMAVVVSAILFGGEDDDTPYSSEQGTRTAKTTEAGEVEIPLSDIDENARFYSYDSGGVSILYFVVKGPDNRIHAAFDACNQCFTEKKGFEQRDDAMKCNSCGKEIRIKDMSPENQGECQPVFLMWDISGKNLTINEEDVLSERGLFA